MVHVAPARSHLLLVVVQRVRGGHKVLDDVREVEVTLVIGLEWDIVVEDIFQGFLRNVLSIL